MSIVARSLSFTSSRILRPPCRGFQQRHHRSLAAVCLAPARTQGARAVDVVRSGQGEPYPSRESEICSEIESVALNEVAPSLSNAFGTLTTTTKEVNILDDPAGFFRYRLDLKLQKLKQAFRSVEESVAPSQFSPTQGDEVVGFVLVSVVLIFLFWVGNYFVPTWIFKETVFKNSEGNEDDNVREFDAPSKLSAEEVDPTDSIELPTNLQPFRGIIVHGFKAGRQKAQEEIETKRKKKRSKKSK